MTVEECQHACDETLKQAHILLGAKTYADVRRLWFSVFNQGGALGRPDHLEDRCQAEDERGERVWMRMLEPIDGIVAGEIMGTTPSMGTHMEERTIAERASDSDVDRFAAMVRRRRERGREPDPGRVARVLRRASRPRGHFPAQTTELDP